MRTAAQVYIAIVLTVSGGLAGAAIAFRWWSNATDKALTLGGAK